MAIGVLCEKQCYAGEEVAAFVGKQSDLDTATSTRARRKKKKKEKRKNTFDEPNSRIYVLKYFKQSHMREGKKKKRCSDDIAGSLGYDSTITDAAVIAIIIGTEI